MDELAQEEQNANYLQEHPAYELSLWQDWVLVVCRSRSMAPPTGCEWDALTKLWYHGKAPLASADELQQLRAATPNVEFNGVPAGHSINHSAGGMSAGTQGYGALAPKRGD